MKRLFACSSLALLSLFALPAQAGHVSVGIGVGVPWPGYYYPHPYVAPYYGPYGPYYGYPAYVAPAPVVVPSAPTTYVERAPMAQNSQDDSWFYCEKDKAYYPYVRQCPGGWVKVPSHPPQAAPQ